MLIELGPQKDAANLTRHGVSLALSGRLDWDAALVLKSECESEAPGMGGPPDCNLHADKNPAYSPTPFS